jgi:large subunit ribosomal protein L2
MKKYSPTSPSRRQMTTVDYSTITKRRPYKPLVKRLKKNAGRNSAGRITTRHQGGGNKRLYRMIDFKQKRLNDPATVLTLEYDPYRTAFIALVEYKSDKSKAYVLAPHGLKVGRELKVAEQAPFEVGNRMKLRNIPVGYQVYSAELQPGQGGILARSAGSYAEVLANADGWTDLKLGSGEVRRINWEGFASIGQVSNPEHNLVTIGKAGRSRWLGIRPTVRGSAMNPVDHPYGGGEGKTQRGTRKPKTATGKVTGGRKTRRRKKQSNKFIVKHRKKK